MIPWFTLTTIMAILAYFLWTMFRPRTFTLDWDQYTKDHKDLCQYLPDCQTWGQTKCHTMAHEGCFIYYRAKKREGGL